MKKLLITLALLLSTAAWARTITLIQNVMSNPVVIGKYGTLYAVGGQYYLSDTSGVEYPVFDLLSGQRDFISMSATNSAYGLEFTNFHLNGNGQLEFTGEPLPLTNDWKMSVILFYQHFTSCTAYTDQNQQVPMSQVVMYPSPHQDIYELRCVTTT